MLPAMASGTSNQLRAKASRHQLSVRLARMAKFRWACRILHAQASNSLAYQTMLQIPRMTALQLDFLENALCFCQPRFLLRWSTGFALDGVLTFAFQSGARKKGQEYRSRPVLLMTRCRVEQNLPPVHLHFIETTLHQHTKRFAKY